MIVVTEKELEAARKAERIAHRAKVKVGSVKVGDLVRGPRGVIAISDLGNAWDQDGVQVQYAYGERGTDEKAVVEFLRRERLQKTL